MNIVRIDDYENHDVISALKELLYLAERNRLRGIAFVYKADSRLHRIGIAGDYWADPAVVLIGISRMNYKVNQILAARDGDPETAPMPL